MKLFCKHSICRQCGVAFEPRKDKYGDLCLPHAKPKLDEDWRKAQVVGWASSNWERLEPEMKKEQEASRAAFNEAMQANLQARADAMRPIPMNQLGGYGGNVLGGLFGGQKMP